MTIISRQYVGIGPPASINSSASINSAINSIADRSSSDDDDERYEIHKGRYKSRRQPWRMSALLQQVIIAVVVLPVSFLISAYEWAARERPSRIARAADGDRRHDDKVERLREDVRRWNSTPELRSRPLRTNRSAAASHSVRVPDKHGAYVLDTSAFNEILGIDVAKCTVRVEPNVTVWEVCSYLLRFDSMLEATLEMEDATLGGLALSQGMTTHSHVCGLVGDTVTAFEMVTADGRLIKATKDDPATAELFNNLPFSHGTLGVLTSLEIRIVPAARYVTLTYKRFDSMEALHRAYDAAIRGGEYFFVEAIVYSPSRAVAVLGNLSTPDEQKTLKINHQSRYYKEWYFKRVEHAEDGEKELMPMRDYLMRHDKSLCMTLEYVFPLGNNPVFRYLFGWVLPPKVTFLKSLRTPGARKESVTKQVYQDLAVPSGAFVETIRLVDDKLEIYPILVYPCKMVRRGGFLRTPEREAGESYCMNLGIYGWSKKMREPKFKTITRVREILAHVRRVRGFQHTYCDVFQTREEFEEMFNVEPSRRLRKEYGCEALPEVYDKVKTEIDWEKWMRAE